MVDIIAFPSFGPISSLESTTGDDSYLTKEEIPNLEGVPRRMVFFLEP